MPLHPVFQAALDAGKAAGRPSLSAAGVAAARAAVDDGAKPLGPGPEVLEARVVPVPGRAGSIPVHVFRPVASPAGVIVYFHGGGWVAGSAASFEALARTLAVRSGCTVVNVDYRLAPEHPFPAGLDDAHDVLRWADAERASLAGAGAPLMVGGDSAGGNLATVAARELAGEIPIALQLLFYPVVGHDFETESYRRWAEGQSLTRADMQWFFGHYAPPAQWSSPRVAPLQAELAGSPPAWLAVAEYDVLRSEGEAYGERLAQAGVPVQVRVWPGLAHGFARWFNLVDVVGAALDDAAAAVRNAVRESTP